MGGGGQMGEQERSVFSFLAPSFLTKLQDFRDEAKEQEFIFIISTNYLDNIDTAAKRSGRIDCQWLISYPDTKSRAYMVLKDMMATDFVHHKLDNTTTLAEASVKCTGCLSYNTMSE